MNPPSSKDVAHRVQALRVVVTHVMGSGPRKLSSEIYKELDRKAIEYLKTVKQSGLWLYLTRLERNFVTTRPSIMDEHYQIQFMWKIEALQVLLWALNLIDVLPQIPQQAKLDLPNPEQYKIPANPSLRPHSEIVHLQSIAELWHWRSRTRQIIEEGRQFPDSAALSGDIHFTSFDDIVRFTAKEAFKQGDLVEIADEDFAVSGKPYRDLLPDEWSAVRSITIERHFALNWLCGYAQRNNWDKTPTDT